MWASIPISQLGFLDTTGVCTHLQSPVFYKPHRELMTKIGFMDSKIKVSPTQWHKSEEAMVIAVNKHKPHWILQILF